MRWLYPAYTLTWCAVLTVLVVAFWRDANYFAAVGYGAVVLAGISGLISFPR